MFKRAVLLSLLLLAPALASAQDRVHTGSIRAAVWIGDRATNGAVAARTPTFAIAMMHYRNLALASWKAGPYPLLASRGLLPGQPFMWVAQDGSHVEKVRQGQFRLTVADSGWFRSVDCFVATWPVFNCSDGETRDMAVPSNSRLMFGKVVFDRVAAAPAPATRRDD